MADLPLLRLRKNEDRRLRSGHLWVFSNEVDIALTPLKGFSPGDLVVIENAKGEPLGTATVNPESLIAARILGRDVRKPIDRAFFTRRLERALALREWAYGEPYYRLIHGESDGLPGLVVDRFGDVFVLQTNTAGMERLQDIVIEALEKMFSPRAVVIRNTSGLRALEGLESYSRVALGQLDERVEIRENGARFLIDPLEGQKTGWFFDHRDNRAALARWCSGKRVLDLFAYTGAWSLPAALAGAASVECVDASAPALELAAENARLNGVADRLAFSCADVFDFLKQAREERQHYDVIVLDPTAVPERGAPDPGAGRVAGIGIVFIPSVARKSPRFAACLGETSRPAHGLSGSRRSGRRSSGASRHPGNRLSQGLFLSGGAESLTH